ncbi:MAG TPA: hypothetical protein VFM29_02455 [Vicinamibacteria bacterium]|nr:hypothetical protein [Vicinamibacteria bacterium]
MDGDRPWSAREVVLRVLVAHLALLGFMALARVFLVPGREDARAILNGLAAWDAQHYLTVATNGYVEDHLIVRLPALPLLIRAVAVVTRSPLVAGYLVVLACHAAAGVYLHRLLRLDESDDVARRAVIAWLAFPTAFTAVVPLTEAPFFLGVVGALFHWRVDQPGRASLFALLAATTRIPGVFLLAALAADAAVRRRDAGRWRAAAVTLAVPAAGLLAYLALNAFVEGDPLSFLAVQREKFSRALASPVSGLREAWAAMDRERPEGIVLGPFEVLGTVVSWAAFLRAARRRQVADAVYTGLSAAAFTFQEFWISNLRYAYVLHPVFPLLARAGRGPVGWMAIVATSLALLAVLAFQFSRGHWAA